LRYEWLAVGVIIVLIAVGLCVVLYRDFRVIRAQETDRLQVQARVIDDNLGRQLEGANSALAWVHRRLATHGPAAVSSEELKLLTDAMPGVRTMTVLDAAGTVLAASREGLVGRSLSDRSYFDAARQHPEPALLLVSPPFSSPLGDSVIVVSRTVTDARGAFAGVVNASLDPDYFTIVLRSVLYAPDMRTMLLHRDGKVFIDVSAGSPAQGPTPAEPRALLRRLQEAGTPDGLLTRWPATGDGKNVLVAVRTIGRSGVPIEAALMTVVSRDAAAVYQPVMERAGRSALLLAVIAAALVTGVSRNHRRRRTERRMADEAAEQRRAGTERLELALRGADLGMWEIDETTGTVTASPRERAMLGFEPDDDVRSLRWRELLHPDDEASVAAALKKHVRGETEAFECEHRIRHRDGRWVWVFSRAVVAERDPAGVPLRMVGTHLDITASKQAAVDLARTMELLRASEEQLRDVTDNLPALVSTLDRDERFCFANRAYREWLGIPPEALVGRTLREVFGEPVHDAIRHHVTAALNGNTVRYERQMTTVDGLRHVHVTLVPRYGGDGSVQGMHGLIQDLTARHRAEQERARSEERLTLAIEGSGLALFDWDIAGGRIYHSAQAAAMRGAPAVEATCAPAEWRSFVHPDDLAPMLARIKDTLSAATPLYHAEFRIRKSSGHWLWVRARGRVVERDVNRRALRLAGTYADISERKASESRLRQLAETDLLTGLPNRAQFLEGLQAAMRRATPEQGAALLFLDIDHFKTINDTLGHEAGDQLLKLFAQRMRDSVRQSDMVARLAGDEFTIILEGLRDAGQAAGVAGKLVEVLRSPIALAGRFYEITASIGVALCEPGDADDAALLRRADQALYEAKRRGRNGFSCEASAPARRQEAPGLDDAHAALREMPTAA
jgi:diguanylate cyclase (GGDEF)-like protein/PAS domain S-box-containing protein